MLLQALMNGQAALALAEVWPAIYIGAWTAGGGVASQVWIRKHKD